MQKHANVRRLAIPFLFALLVSPLLLSLKSVGHPNNSIVSLVILGTLQDGGSPHAGCRRSCCKDLFTKPIPDRKVVSLGVIDHVNNATYLFEATPDLPAQMNQLRVLLGDTTREAPNGIFLTHAHIGHYTGLMYLGKEAMDAKSIHVFAMPRMKSYLETNGPWSQLVSRKNILLQEINNGSTITMGNVSVTPLRVPHRDEYSETIGFRIRGPKRSALFIPDIDKWEKWDRDIVQEIRRTDYVFIDATFYDEHELPGRTMIDIPHPLIVESMALFDSLPTTDRSKIYFIHLNHTNPALLPESKASQEILRRGYHIAHFGNVLEL